MVLNKFIFITLVLIEFSDNSIKSTEGKVYMLEHNLIYTFNHLEKFYHISMMSSVL